MFFIHLITRFAGASPRKGKPFRTCRLSSPAASTPMCRCAAIAGRWPLQEKRETRRGRRHDAPLTAGDGGGGKAAQKQNPRQLSLTGVGFYTRFGGYFTRWRLILREVVFSNSVSRSSSALIFLKEGSVLSSSTSLAQMASYTACLSVPSGKRSRLG